jgi:hypothetical protein
MLHKQDTLHCTDKDMFVCLKIIVLCNVMLYSMMEIHQYAKEHTVSILRVEDQVMQVSAEASFHLLVTAVRTPNFTFQILAHTSWCSKQRIN